MNIKQWYSSYLHWVPGLREDIAVHSERTHVLTEEDTTEHTDDMMTFHFSVMDLPFFVNEKPWTMNEANNSTKNEMTHRMNQEAKTTIFMNHHERATMLSRFPENTQHVTVPDFAQVFL